VETRGGQSEIDPCCDCPPDASISATAALFKGRSNLAQGEVRCEGAGAIVININGEEYAVNGMASRRYPPIQRVWNATTYPQSNIDRIIVTGLTLCDWGSKSASALALNAGARN
jgi:hypothetical protein